MGEEEVTEVRFTLPQNFDPEKEREITSRLLNCSENVEAQKQRHAPLLINSWVDALGGWIIDSDKNSERVLKKKKVKKAISERENKFDGGDFGGNSFNNGGQLTSRSDEDPWPGFVPDWKAGVEAHTYRYVPNNGRYRARKFTKTFGGPPAKIQRHVYDRPIQLTMEQKILQKEIQRDLRREFEQHEVQKVKTEQRQKESLNNATSNNEYHKKGLSPVTKDLKFQKPGSPISKSASDSDTPAINLPLMGKTVSDNFIDKFTTKISIFEEEVRSDLKKFNKKSGVGSDHDKIDNSGFRLGRLKTESRSKQNGGKTSQKTEQLTQETFCVRRIYKNSDKSYLKQDRIEDLQQDVNIGVVAGANIHYEQHFLQSSAMGDNFRISVPLSSVSTPDTPKGNAYEEISPWYEKERVWIQDYDQGKSNSNHVPDTKLLEGSLTTTRYGAAGGPSGDSAAGISSNNSSADSKRKTTYATGSSNMKSANTTNNAKKRTTNKQNVRTKQKQHPPRSVAKEEASGYLMETDDASTQFILNGFRAAPLRGLKDQEMTRGDKPDTLNNPFKTNILPQIAGKRIQVPVGSNRVM